MKLFKPKSIIRLVEEYRVPFGQYRGYRLQDVGDIDYLNWLAEKSYSRFNRVIVKAYLEAWKEFAYEKPFYISDEQLTTFIMMKRQKNKEKEKDELLNEN